ncbi:MAG TPA: tannase/feruloyl esterase family alpha/beta hydrolase [Rhizomicrobium sp.]|jgi:feruloyl esterase
MKILAWGALAALAAVMGVQAQLAVTPCADLTALQLPHVTISEASIVAGPGGGYCKVLGAAHPTPDSDIRFEVVIPQNWNYRYLQVGNGGFAGVIPERAMMALLAQGYAVAGTDDGHQDTVNTDAGWALKHPEKAIDFGYRAIKETTDAAKAIIIANKDVAPRYSYFQGCSDGGREALMEAQRYPGDFNGIIAGDPANHWTHLLAGAAFGYQALTATPDSFLSLDKLRLVEVEAVKQCGDEFGVIEDPQACRFNPDKLRCASGDAPTCLTSAQIAALRKLYDGPKNPRTGEKLIAGFSPGGEGEDNGWSRWITGATPDGKDALIYKFAANFFGNIVFADPNYDLKRLNFDSDIAVTDANAGPIFNSYNPDLSAFRDHGGKLIQYHGWADPAIPAQDSVDYWSLVRSRMGTTDTFYRLFMAPGMLHCGGGPGPNILAVLPAISAWVEQDKAPEMIIATKYKNSDATGGIERTRPLCAYPAKALWDGTGDRTKAESFRCVETR